MQHPFKSALRDDALIGDALQTDKATMAQRIQKSKPSAPFHRGGGEKKTHHLVKFISECNKVKPWKALF